MKTRVALPDDTESMSQVLREIVVQTGRERPADTAFVTARYIADPTSIRCTVAVDATGRVIGFQSLKKAEAGNPYDVPEGWGIIGTHISPRAHRKGVGKMLLSSSIEAAKRAGLEKIDAYISADNTAGLCYYEAMGFRTYRESVGIIQKALIVANFRTDPG